MIIYMKQAQVPAVARWIDDERVRAYFLAPGPPHRRVAAGPAGARRSVGWATPRWAASGSWSPRSRRTPPTWTGPTVNEADELAGVITDLGRAVARMHSVADDESSHDLVDFSTEEAIVAAVDKDEGRFRRAPGRLRPPVRRPGPRGTTRTSSTLFRNGRLPGPLARHRVAPARRIIGCGP